MFYRDFMQKFRPVYAPPDAPGGGEAAPVIDAGGGAPAPAAESAPAPAASEAAAPAAEPSLLEAAQATLAPKPEGEAAPAADAATAESTESPAPAEAATEEGAKAPDANTEADGAKAPDAEADAAKADPDDKGTTAEAQPPEPIKYEAFKLPEGVALDEKELSKFTEVAGKAQIPQDVAQNLIDLYVDERKQDLARAEQHQRDTWRKLNDTWKSDFRKDQELGGNRADTTLSRAKAVIEEYGGTPDQQRDLMAHIGNNGMGNYVGFIRLLNNIGEMLNVFEDTHVPANPNPPRGGGSRSERWYGGTNGKA